MQDVQSIEGAECGMEPGPVTLPQPALGSGHSSLNPHSLRGRTPASWAPGFQLRLCTPWKDVQAQVHLCLSEPG